MKLFLSEIEKIPNAFKIIMNSSCLTTYMLQLKYQ